MKEFINKLIERLNAELPLYASGWRKDMNKIINQLAEEYNNGWIPCSERLPSEATVYEVTEEIVLCSKKQYIVEHRLFGTEGEWLCPSNRKVIAWQPLPKPYQPKGE